MAAVDAATLRPLTHAEALALQVEELRRAVALLRDLDERDWLRRTDCPGWDVRRMYLHVLGACEAGARIPENLHQLRVAYLHRRRHGGPLEAALSGVQVREREHLAPAAIVDALETVAPKTVKGRALLPGPIRRVAKIPVDGPVVERWSLDYLTGTIYLRDLWMHRIDACRAVDRRPELTADHDGRIVADVVAEWAGRHGRPFVLELTGPAGGSYRQGAADGADDVEHHTLDAVELCRTLAGREPGTGLLATIVPF